jgi:hypothetical protein
MNFNEISRLENKFEEFLKVYCKEQREIILYGAGLGSDWAMRLLSNVKIKPSKIAAQQRGGYKE